MDVAGYDRWKAGDPPSMTEAEEQELAEQIAAETDDLRAAITGALDEYGGELLSCSDRRAIAIEAIDAWIAKRLGRV